MADDDMAREHDFHNTLSAADTRIRARAKSNSLFLLVVCGVVVALIAAGAFVIGTILSGQDRDRVVSHNAVVAQRAVATADNAKTMANRNAVIIFAVCRAFSRRDKAAQYYDERLDEVRQRYGYGSSAFLDHAKPIIEQRKKVLGEFADGDCTKLMNRAMSDAQLPAAIRPTPAHLVPGQNF